MKIIAGLGNPGEKYLKTRHNLGFMVIDRFAQQIDAKCDQRKFQSLFCKITKEQEEIILLKPQTFMNLSGAAVKEATDMYRCELQNLMVICDDLDLPLGRIRIKCGGGYGGHRGLKSIGAYLGSTDFPRLRIGIGRPVVGDPRNYVLSVFSKEEEAIVVKVIENACRALMVWVFEGIEVCMNRFN